MDISRRICSLPGGQVAILSVVAVIAVVGLQSVHSTVAARAAIAANAVYEHTEDLSHLLRSIDDSLHVLRDTSYRNDRVEESYLRVNLNRQRIGLPTIPYLTFLEEQLRDDSIKYEELHRRRGFIQSDLDSLPVQSVVWSNVGKVRLFSLDAAIGAIALSLLSFLWIWFGGQRTQLTGAEASVAQESRPTARGITWNRVTANPVVRVLGWLLLILLALIVFRIGEEVVLAIRSVL